MKLRLNYFVFHSEDASVFLRGCFMRPNPVDKTTLSNVLTVMVVASSTVFSLRHLIHSCNLVFLFRIFACVPPVVVSTPFPACRRGPVSRRLRCRLEPRLRRREEALVHFYAGATTGIAGVLQGLPKRPDLARACRSADTSGVVVSGETTC